MSLMPASNAPVLFDYDAESAVATITFNRPDVLNAINVEMADGLMHACDQIAKIDTVRCILINGNGAGFVAGGDVQKFADESVETANIVDQLLDSINPAVYFLRTHKAPVVASVHGVVAGAGLSIMAACDIVIASQNTRFLMAYDQVAAPPDCGGSYFLPRLLGERRAAELMFLGARWTANQAMQYNLVNTVVPDDILEAETEAMVKRIANGPSAAFAAYKELVRADADALLTHLELERTHFKAATRTSDFKEGVNAFCEKRKAKFIGK